MKEFLLDTHILLWWLNKDSKLPPVAKDLIYDPANIIWISAASVWEAAIKRKLGKLMFEDTLLFNALLNGDWRMLSITAQHSLIAADLPAHHHDPFDRMLIAQTLYEGFTLVTHDKTLTCYEAPIIYVN